MMCKRVGLTASLALGVIWAGCVDEEDVAGLGGESGTTEAPRRVSGLEAQEIAEAISIDGAEKVRRALPEPSDDPASPSVRSLRDRDIGVARSRLDIEFQSESRAGGGALRGAYLQLEGADFYWDVPERSLKQNEVTETDDVTIQLDLPDLTPGIEFCFTVCVYSSEELVSRPETTCITVPNLDESQQRDIESICEGLDACDLAGDDCVTQLTRDVASVQAFAEGCDDTVADAVSCLAGATDDCELLASVFGEGDERVPTTGAPESGADSGGDARDTGAEDPGGTTGTAGSGMVVAGEGSADAGVATMAPESSFSLAIPKQNAGACESELEAFGQCVQEAEGGSTSAGGSPSSGTGGTSTTGGEMDTSTDTDTGGLEAGGTTGTDSGSSTTGSFPTTTGGEDAGAGTGTSTTGGEDGGQGGTTGVDVDVCESTAVTDYQAALDAYVDAVGTAQNTPCSETCSVEQPPIGGCYIVSDGASINDVVDAHNVMTAAESELNAQESDCVQPRGGTDVCGAQVFCFQGVCMDGSQF